MARSVYLRFHPVRSPVALVAGFLIVAAVALSAKFLIERYTRWSYVIHWWETVPFLVLMVALVINGAWNRRAAPR